MSGAKSREWVHRKPNSQPTKPKITRRFYIMAEKSTFNKTFSLLGLNEWIVKQCDAVGMKTPTPIQYNCVPEILKGKCMYYRPITTWSC